MGGKERVEKEAVCFMMGRWGVEGTSQESTTQEIAPNGHFSI